MGGLREVWFNAQHRSNPKRPYGRSSPRHDPATLAPSAFHPLNPLASFRVAIFNLIAMVSMERRGAGSAKRPTLDVDGYLHVVWACHRTRDCALLRAMAGSLGGTHCHSVALRIIVRSFLFRMCMQDIVHRLRLSRTQVSASMAFGLIWRAANFSGASRHLLDLRALRSWQCRISF